MEQSAVAAGRLDPRKVRLKAIPCSDPISTSVAWAGRVRSDIGQDLTAQALTPRNAPRAADALDDATFFVSKAKDP